MRQYFGFMAKHWQLLAFGLLLSLCSNFGQTFFISLFSGEIRNTFQLSHGDFGAIYSLATLTSATLLMWLGRRIDDFPLRLFTLIVMVGLAGACILLAVTPPAWFTVGLFLSLLGLRLFGQGLMTHTAATSMGRYFKRNRGKAVSIATYGHPIGEALFPVVAVALMAGLGWRDSWLIIAGSVLFMITPGIMLLLKQLDLSHPLDGEEIVTSLKGPESPAPQHRHRLPEEQTNWTLSQVLKDLRLYGLLPALLAPAFLLTGIFFHQVYWFSIKGWDPTLYASMYIWFALGSVISSFMAGLLVDRFGAIRLVSASLIPLMIAILSLTSGNAIWIAGVFLWGAGMTMGFMFVLSGSLWPELYGVAHLGSIRAFFTAMMVFCTALAPIAFGYAIDHQVTMDSILHWSAVYCALTAFLALWSTGQFIPGDSSHPAQKAHPNQSMAESA